MRPQKRRTGPYQALSQMIAQVGKKEGEDEDLGIPIVAAFLGITSSTLYKLLDPDQGGDISFTRVCQITERYGVTAAADHLAGCAGLVATQDEPSSDTDSIVQLMSRIAKDEGDLLTAFLDSWSDLRIDDKEQARMEEILADLIKCAFAMRRALRAGGKNGMVVPIRGSVA